MRLRFLARWPVAHHVIHRAFPRAYVQDGVRFVSCPVCAFVWRQIEREADFFADWRRG